MWIGYTNVNVLTLPGYAPFDTLSMKQSVVKLPGYVMSLNYPVDIL